MKNADIRLIAPNTEDTRSNDFVHKQRNVILKIMRRILSYPPDSIFSELTLTVFADIFLARFVAFSPAPALPLLKTFHVTEIQQNTYKSHNS